MEGVLPSNMNNLMMWVMGFHFGLVLYALITVSRDTSLHMFIFFSGVFAVLLFSLSKVAFENRMIFMIIVVMFITTFYSSIVLYDVNKAFSDIAKWLVVIVYNIGSTRTMRLVDVQKVARRNIILNTLALILNLIYDLM